MSPSPSLDTGLLIGTQSKLILFERFFVPNPVIEIENFSGFSGKIWISGENPTPMLPRLDGVLMQPAPHCATANRSNETRLPDMIHNIFNAPARKGDPIFNGQFTGDRFNLDDEIWGEKPGGGPVENVLRGPRDVAQRTVFATCRQPPVVYPIWLQFDHCLDPVRQGESFWPGEP